MTFTQRLIIFVVLVVLGLLAARALDKLIAKKIDELFDEE